MIARRPPAQAHLEADADDSALIDELEALLDALPPPLEPFDVSALDGFLVGVLLQPQPVAAARWLPHVHDAEARPAAPGLDLHRLHELATQRHAALAAAIAKRQWFDPWVFELDDATPAETVLPWVAGFAASMELFPGVMRLPPQHTLEPLATLYMHFDADDLDDADELLAEIETLEPAADLAEAVEGLVRSTLQLADAAQPEPVRRTPAPRRRSPAR